MCSFFFARTCVRVWIVVELTLFETCQIIGQQQASNVLLVRGGTRSKTPASGPGPPAVVDQKTTWYLLPTGESARGTGSEPDGGRRRLLVEAAAGSLARLVLLVNRGSADPATRKRTPCLLSNCFARIHNTTRVL